MIKKIFLYLWQLPQNLLGLLIILCCKNKKMYGYWVVYWKAYFGVCLGQYIIFSDDTYYVTSTKLKHERGHQKQSLYLGWLYLIVIGLPSITGNIINRCFHKKWSLEKKLYWYYNQPWEKWADELSNIKRNFNEVNL